MKALLREVWQAFCKAAAETPRMYFAPLTGAIKGIRAEYRCIDEEFSKRYPLYRDSVWSAFCKAAAETPRMYFAPIAGAIKGIRAEYRHLSERTIR